MITILRRGGMLRAAIRTTTMVTMIGCMLALSASQQGASAHKGTNSASKNAREANASTGNGRSFSGTASFYGNEDEPSGKTASGQRFNEEAMTAAHRTLPFGTRLKVTHSGRSVVVTVNDRGPFIKGRVLDLSAGAARAIGINKSKGLGQIFAEVQ